MRTTIDLPADLHARALSIARDTSRSLSETVADLLRRGLDGPGRVDLDSEPDTGLPVIRVGRVVTTEEVRSLEDDAP